MSAGGASKKHGGPARNRTGVGGFAIPSVTTPPQGQHVGLAIITPNWSAPIQPETAQVNA